MNCDTEARRLGGLAFNSSFVLEFVLFPVQDFEIVVYPPGHLGMTIELDNQPADNYIQDTSSRHRNTSLHLRQQRENARPAQR